MPIRGIEVYVRELKLAQETRISALAETRLGIEGHNWIRQLLLNTRDGDAVAMGGLPGTLEADIIKEVEFLRKNSITPIVVFNGLPVARKDGRVFGKDDARPANRNKSWELYWQKHTEQAQRGWASAPAQAQGDMVPFVMHVLQGLGVETMRAPYSSWGQLAYLYKHEAQAVHAVYASLDMLMFDVDRVVTSVSSTKSTFSWVQREHLLSKCGVTSEQVVDMCILAGFDWCPTFPGLVGESGFSFKFAVDTVRQFRSGFNAIQMLGDQPGAGSTSYSDSFLRAHCIVRYHIVLLADGGVGPLNSEYAPNDLHDIIGYRVPTVVYQLMAQGVIQPAVVQMMVSGAWPEFPPADNGDAKEYQRLVTEWERDVLRHQCTRLSKSMGPFFGQRKVAMQAWFEPQTEIVLQSGSNANSHGDSSSKEAPAAAPISTKAFASVFKGQPVSLGSVLEHSEELAIKEEGEGADSEAPESDGDHAYAEVLLSVAADLGLTGSTGRRTRVGQAAIAGIRALQRKGEKATAALEWAALAGAILVSQGALSGDKWSVAYEDEQWPVGSDARQQKHIRWLSRIAALMGVGKDVSPQGGQWDLMLNRDVLAFSSAARLVLKAASASADAACVGLARTGSGAWGNVASAPDAKVVARVRELRAQMPLECAASAASGLVAHAVLAGLASGKRADVSGVDGAQQALSDTWVLSAAVLTAAEALGATTAATELRSARSWAEPALKRA
ncbi:hypothetical protein GGH94_002591 [Coemansia aciculifera]|uniref:PIN domain-like protein n=1 Tax=Coemansia aciculifera TaxID=417176 RepID=A0A9W8IS11_9FUNG|nr:hypothetical protein GGH94_002591 [Coemansia aciculifera]KAJ2876155.1 hypothetical protein GGH93_000983 [Coemansia aciculifera]